MRAAWAPGPGPEPEPGSSLGSGGGGGGDGKRSGREPPWRDDECISAEGCSGGCWRLSPRLPLSEVKERLVGRVTRWLVSGAQACSMQRRRRHQTERRGRFGSRSWRVDLSWTPTDFVA